MNFEDKRFKRAHTDAGATGINKKYLVLICFQIKLT